MIHVHTHTHTRVYSQSRYNFSFLASVFFFHSKSNAFPHFSVSSNFLFLAHSLLLPPPSALLASAASLSILFLALNTCKSCLPFPTELGGDYTIIYLWILGITIIKKNNNKRLLAKCQWEILVSILWQTCITFYYNCSLISWRLFFIEFELIKRFSIVTSLIWDGIPKDKCTYVYCGFVLYS